MNLKPSLFDKSLCPNGCTNAQLQALKNNQIAASTAQKKANDALLRGLDKQQQTLQVDAKKLRLLQQPFYALDFYLAF